MPTQPGSVPWHGNAEEKDSVTEFAPLSTSAKQAWETPELKMMAMEGTESGPFFAIAEYTTPVPARPLAS